MSATKPKIGQSFQELWIDDQKYFHNHGENGAKQYREVRDIDWEKFWKDLQEKCDQADVGLMATWQATATYRAFTKELIEEQLKGELK